MTRATGCKRAGGKEQRALPLLTLLILVLFFTVGLAAPAASAAEHASAVAEPTAPLGLSTDSAGPPSLASEKSVDGDEHRPRQRVHRIRKPIFAAGVAVFASGISTMALISFPEKILFGDYPDIDRMTAGKILLASAFLGELVGGALMAIGLAGETVLLPIPPNMQVATVHRRSRRLTSVALGLFAASYGLALAGSVYLAVQAPPHCVDCKEVSRVLWIPVAGPIVADVVDSSGTLLGSAWLATWSLTQLAGASLLAAALHGRDVDELRPLPTSSIEIKPQFGLHSAGLSLEARF